MTPARSRVVGMIALALLAILALCDNLARAHFAAEAEDSARAAADARAPLDPLPRLLPVEYRTPIGLRIGRATLWIDSTTIRASARLLHGTEPAYHLAADTADGREFYCYQTKDASPVIVLLSGHPDKGATLVDMELTRKRGEDMPPRCTALAVPASAISNTLGLRLGMPRQELESRFGAGSTYDGSRSFVTYTLRVNSAPRSPLDHMVTLYVTYDGDEVVAIMITRLDELSDVEGD